MRSLRDSLSRIISRRDLLFPSVLLAAGIILLLRRGFVWTAEQHFVFLAHSFLHGSLHFTAIPGYYWDDTSLYQGRYYWPLGPMPAIILLPFVFIFGFSMHQRYLLFFLNILNLFLIYKIARKMTAARTTSCWLAFGYVFSTAYLFVAVTPWSWYFAQVTGTAFLLLALYECLHGRRWWLIGLYLAMAVATRVNLLLAMLFFSLTVIFSSEERSDKIPNLVRLFLPVALSGALLLLYNQARFGELLEFGYRYQLIGGEQATNRDYGLWSFRHFPANLYYLFFRGPEGVFLPNSKVLAYPFLRPDKWGMSTLFTSPLFLWIFRASPRERMVQFSGLTALIMLFAQLGYYGIGVRQYGYRYALDFYPFLLLILCCALRERMSGLLKGLIILTFLFNSYLIPLVFIQ